MSDFIRLSPTKFYLGVFKIRNTLLLTIVNNGFEFEDVTISFVKIVYNPLYILTK